MEQNVEELQTCTKSNFVTKFTRDEMIIYDLSKDQQMEKLKLKIVKKYEFYVSINLNVRDI